VVDVEQYSPSDRKFWVQLDNNESYHVQGTHTFTVRWLADTPQAAPAGEQGDAAALDTANKLIDQLHRDEARLQAERDDLKRQLAATGESITAARQYIAQLFDPEQRFDTNRQGGFVTETLNFAEAHLADAQDVVKGKVATPPPAPDVSALVAAVQPFVNVWKDWIEYLSIMPDDDVYTFNEYIDLHSIKLESVWEQLAEAAALKAGGE